MAFEEVLQSFTMEAAGDLSSDQYHFVKVTANKTVGACDTAGEAALGVNQGNVDGAGKSVQVGFHGISKVEASATIAGGDLVATTAAGLAATATTGQTVLGVALIGGDVGELIPVLLYQGGAGTAA